MQNSTLKNSSHYHNCDKNTTILKVIDYSINHFCSQLGFKNGYFSKFLNYSENQFPKYLNPYEHTHNLKITDLETILFNLDKPHKKIILDSLCHTNGFICIDEDSNIDNFSSLENLLLSISATNGNLANSFLESIKDGNINDDERHQLKCIAYQLREFLINFENRILETN